VVTSGDTAVTETEPVDASYDNVPDVRGPVVRVLFADDSAAMRTLARYALTAQRGFSVVGEASDGAQALLLAERHLPDCIVLDIEMPGMGGFEALAELRRRCPTTPVVMLSGYSDDAVRQRALDGGAVACLDKSSELKQLGLIIQRVTTQAGHGPSAATAETATPALIVGSSRPARVSTAVDASASAASPRPTASTTAALDDLHRLEYVISHELGEPLRIMKGFVTLLTSRYSDELDEAGQTFLDHVSGAAARMQSMIDDLLTYSRAGSVQPHPRHVDLTAVVVDTFGSLGARIAERGATATVEDLPGVVGDPLLLTQVMEQLVVNAITFTTSGAPTVHVSGHATGNTAVITVEDNGIGIDPANSERVFDLFQRLNTREEYPGNGAGLSLCRRLLELQGGSIGLVPGSQGGTAVSITLPRSINHEGDSA
jgi:signal transduction histidine kinase